MEYLTLIQLSNKRILVDQLWQYRGHFSPSQYAQMDDYLKRNNFSVMREIKS